MSNAYVAKLAPMAEKKLPKRFSLETHPNWPGAVFWKHTDGGSGLIQLLSVDNRRRPTDDDATELAHLVGMQVRSQVGDYHYTAGARDQAWAALMDWRNSEGRVKAMGATARIVQ